MQTVPQELRVLLEVVSIGSLCGWVVSLLCRPGFLPPHRAMLIGVPGMFLGWQLWGYLGWPTGPSFEGYALLPALIGAFLVFLAASFVEEFRRDDRHLPRSKIPGDSLEARLTEPRRGHHR